MMAVATSIPPRIDRLDAGRPMDEAYQRLCIRSWIDNGFRILSVNHPAEIPDLAARFPEVQFIAAERNASARTGRKNPYIADLLAALREAPEKVLGIVNADVVFEHSPEWRSRLPSLVEEALVVGQRCNADSLLQGILVRYVDGIDFFFFDKLLVEAALPHAMPFAMGLPWWDIWLPCVAAIHNRRVLMVDRPAIVHLVHPQGFGNTDVHEFGAVLANFIVKESERASYRLPDAIAAVVPACRTIAATSPDIAASPEYRRAVARLWDLMPLLIRKDVVHLTSEPDAASLSIGSGNDRYFPRQLTTENIFRAVDERLAAGQALIRAKELIKEKSWAEARQALLVAATHAPDDFDVLMTIADFATEVGELENALQALSAAAKQRPHSTRVLGLKGTVLRSLGRTDEAVECFRELVRLKPEAKGVHRNLAIVLMEAGQLDEALLCLKRALDRWPDSVAMAELHHGIASKRDAGSKAWWVVGRCFSIAKWPTRADTSGHEGHRTPESLAVIRSLGGSGGTLLAQIFGALPNAILLSETNPRSTSLHSGALNPLLQIRRWRPELAKDFADFDPFELGYPPRFGDFLRRLHDRTRQLGYHLIIRDYNYVDFVGAPFIWPVPNDCSLDAAAKGQFAIKDFLLVRHPADQLASLRKHRSVARVLTAQRFLDGYWRFLKTMSGRPRFRYEDLVATPEGTFRYICQFLDIPFDGRALVAFRDVTTVTGNLERLSEGGISARPRSTAAHRADEELWSLPSYRRLLKDLGYEERRATRS